MYLHIRPSSEPYIDMDYIRKKVMKEKPARSLYDRIMRVVEKGMKNEHQYKVFDRDQLQEATEMVIRKIFTSYFKRDFKEEHLKYKGREDIAFSKAVHYEAASNAMCISVFVCGGNLLYIATVQTENYREEIKVCYYDEKNMMRNDDTYLMKVLEDFSFLLRECKNLTRFYEYSQDRPPRGVIMDDGSAFYGVHETRILRPMHYYAGVAQEYHVEIDRSSGVTVYDAEEIENLKMLPFDQWYVEIFDGLYE